MLGLSLMVDDFRADNGATRFIPGSHRRTDLPSDRLADVVARHPDEVLACGPAGSIILFDASTWHGHTANSSGQPRRSLQATYIPYTGRPATNVGAQTPPTALASLSETARSVLGLPATLGVASL